MIQVGAMTEDQIGGGAILRMSPGKFLVLT
jgi:hypothetical protein